MKHFELCDLADETISQLENDGITLNAQDVLTIQRLSLGASDFKEYARGKPVEAGGEWFYPLTIGATSWFAEALEVKQIAENQRLQLYAFAYASAHARQKIEATGKRILPEVLRWRRNLTCRIDELCEALSEITDETLSIPSLLPAVDANISGEQYDADDLTLLMCALVGGEPEAWRWQCDIPSAIKIIEKRLALDGAEGRESRKSKSVECLKELAEFCRQIRERKNGENN